MKKLIEILDEQSSKRHPTDDSYYADGSGDTMDVFDGRFRHVQQAADAYALQFIDAIQKQVDDQCGNEYGTLKFIDNLKKKLPMDNIKQLYVSEMNNKHEFQKELAAFAMKNNLKTIVETGYGISTIHFLYAMKHTLDMEDANLYSIDPSPWYGKEIISPQLHHIKEKSLDAMKNLFLLTGAWDLFLHDGNHDILCQTYEYNFAFGCVRPGGYIASDDHTWGGHNAWKNFLANHDLKPFTIGSVEIVQKPLYVPVFENIEMYHEQCLALAENAEENWISSGNKNSDIQWVKV